MAKRIQSWEVSDAFGKPVNPMVPQPERDKEKNYEHITGGGRKPIPYRRVFEGIVYYLIKRKKGSFNELPFRIIG